MTKNVLESKLEQSAIDVAKEAGAYLRQRSESARSVRMEDAKDIKLKADVDSETLIRNVLTKETGLPIIGEEMGGESGLLRGKQKYWVVDPLDGTYNYFRGQTETCVSIGLMEGLQFLFGVVYNFNTDGMVYGGKGKGIFFNDESVQVHWVDKLEKACLMTGFPMHANYTPPQLMDYMGKVMQFKKVRMIGSAAWALANVALGRADAYYEQSTRLWDIAAGAALVEAAGGYVEIKFIEEEELILDAWAGGREEWASVFI